jgi:hypothetical protein
LTCEVISDFEYKTRSYRAKLMDSLLAGKWVPGFGTTPVAKYHRGEFLDQPLAGLFGLNSVLSVLL